MDAIVTTSVTVKNIRGVMDDIVSGNFNQEVMKVESKSIPIISNRTMIRVGVECEGVTANDVHDVELEVIVYYMNLASTVRPAWNVLKCRVFSNVR